MTAIVELKDATVKVNNGFDTEKIILDHVNLTIREGDFITILGGNGAGKSTMLKILAGLQSPTRGVVATPKDVTIGYLPQVMILSDNRTVMGVSELAF